MTKLLWNSGASKRLFLPGAGSYWTVYFISRGTAATVVSSTKKPLGLTSSTLRKLNIVPLLVREKNERVFEY